MVTVAWEDIASVVSQIAGYLAVIGIALIAMIIVMVAVRKVKRPKKGFIRLQSLIAFLVVTVIMVNAICLGPERNMITAAMADKPAQRVSLKERLAEMQVRAAGGNMEKGLQQKSKENRLSI